MEAMKMKLLVVSVVFGLVSTAVPASAQQCTWSAPGSGVRGGDDDTIAMTGFNDGTGPVLYAGGRFDVAGCAVARGISKWDGTEWSSFCDGVGFRPHGGVLSFLVFDDGTGPALYVGGDGFSSIEGVPANRIAKWDGKQWSALGSGMSGAPAPGVYALTVFDDGGGPALYAAGNFTMAGGVAANRIAKWDGTQWSPLGSGMNDVVNALKVFNDGTGPALYAGGNFSMAGGVAASHIAKWDGTQWSALGLGTDAVGVLDLELFNDGTGPGLYACGPFLQAGGVVVNHVAKWNGKQWSALGSGLGNNNAHKLVVFDDGTGPALYVGGTFTMAGGMPVSRLAKWNGKQWSAVGSGVDDTVFSLAVFDDGTGPALYVGGRFAIAGGVPARNIVKYRCTAP
jgi:hypothetical protein